jgi:LacI family transcriptional regulator
LAAQLGIRVEVCTAPHDLDGAAAIATELLGAGDRPTAVFCLADSIAFGVYAAAGSFGLAIPDDLSVLGYDDRPVSRILSPPLSTFHWPIEELVDTVVERTVQAVDEGRRGRRRVLRPVLVGRESIGPPPVR